MYCQKCNYNLTTPFLNELQIKHLKKILENQEYMNAILFINKNGKIDLKDSKAFIMHISVDSTCHNCKTKTLFTTHFECHKCHSLNIIL